MYFKSSYSCVFGTSKVVKYQHPLWHIANTEQQDHRTDCVIIFEDVEGCQENIDAGYDLEKKIINDLLMVLNLKLILS